MHPKRTERIARLLVLMLLFVGCAKKASDEVDAGTLKNSVYENEYFGFSVTLPRGWIVLDQKAQQRLVKKGVQRVVGDNEELKAAAKDSESQTVYLFTASARPIGALAIHNASIMGIAETVRELSGIERGKDYLLQTRKTVEAVAETAQAQVSFPKDYYAESLGGVEFDVMELEMSRLGKVTKQKYYAAIKKGYALCFIVSFANDDDAALLQKILDSVAFK